MLTPAVLTPAVLNLAVQEPVPVWWALPEGLGAWALGRVLVWVSGRVVLGVLGGWDRVGVVRSGEFGALVLPVQVQSLVQFRL